MSWLDRVLRRTARYKPSQTWGRGADCNDYPTTGAKLNDICRRSKEASPRWPAVLGNPTLKELPQPPRHCRGV